MQCSRHCVLRLERQVPDPGLKHHFPNIVLRLDVSLRYAGPQLRSHVAYFEHRDTNSTA